MRLCVVGNLLGRNPGYITTQGLILADLLSTEGHTVISVSSKINRLFRLIEMAFTVIRHRKSIDVLILEIYSGLNILMSDTVSILGRFFGLPMIYVLHGGNLPEFSKKYPRWTKGVFARADMLVAPSAFLAKGLGHLGLPIRVVPNIVDIDKYPYKIRRNIEPRLIWMRAFHSNYHPEMAIEVLNLIRRKHPRASLVMAGVDKGLESEIKKMVLDMGLQEAVRFPGFLGHDAKGREFSQADIYINTNRVDNMPVAVIEACAMGLPVIATKVGGIPDLIDDGMNGILVPDGDAAGMADAVNSLLEDPELSEKLSSNGRLLAELSSWESVRICWDELFAEILKTRSSKKSSNNRSVLTSNKKSLVQGVYNRLPASSRSFVASMRGYYLGWWRYDRQTDKLVEEALERDRWTDEQWNNWRSDRLSHVLRRAATDVPYYREMWAERRRNGDNSSWEDLKNWPILEKAVLRSRGSEFIADGLSRSRMYHEHTSGTTGTPLDLWLTRQSVKEWYALFEARCRSWYGFTRKDRWAILGGQLVTPVKQLKPPFWVWNKGLNQLYMSSYHLAPHMTEYYLRALAKYRIRYIIGYPSAIYSLALSAAGSKVKGLRIETVITNAEPLYDHQREAISQAFDCPVRETYGMAEIAAAASECEHGRLHIWPDAGIIETESNAAADSPSSDIICTGLINADMPLIRYRVGDRGRLSGDKCDCGRNLPIMESIDGRSDDVLYTADGRSVGRLDPIFKGGLPILEAQIIQESLKKITVKFVRAEGFKNKALEPLAGRIRERLGDVEVIFEEMSKIPRTSNGKFRAVICNLGMEELAELRAGATSGTLVNK